MKTLYVTDLDGTLLQPDATLSPRSVSLLNRLIGSGAMITAATARSWNSAGGILAPVGLSLPVICMNGVVLYNPAEASNDICAIPPGTAERLVRGQLAAGLSPMVYTFEDGRFKVKWLAGRTDDGIRSYVSQRPGDDRMTPVGSVAELLTGRVHYTTTIAQRERLERFADDRIDGITAMLSEDIYTAGEYWLEYRPSSAGKAAAALRLKRALQADRLVCFGDNLNDAEMLAAADVGCAVANALADIRSQADEVIGSNLDDAVPRWIAADFAINRESL